MSSRTRAIYEFKEERGPWERGGNLVIVYIFAHLHRALRTEGNMLDIN